MGELSKPQKFMLYSLGLCESQLNARFAGKPFEITMSKAAFIELARAAGMVSTKERALYKNLEGLEHRKLIAYDHKDLALTVRGKKVYDKLSMEFSPYITVSKLLDSQNVLKYSKKTKTVLARNV